MKFFTIAPLVLMLLLLSACDKSSQVTQVAPTGQSSQKASTSDAQKLEPKSKTDAAAGYNQSPPTIAGGEYTAFAIEQSGKVRTWMMAREYEEPSASLSPAVAVVAGMKHACTLDSKGQVRCWGPQDYVGIEKILGIPTDSTTLHFDCSCR